MIPVLRPLKDPAVATVWSGLAASTIGEDLFRVAVVWIAAEQIGNAAGYVNAAQYAACLLYTSPSPRDRQKSRMPSSA